MNRARFAFVLAVMLGLLVTVLMISGGDSKTKPDSPGNVSDPLDQAALANLARERDLERIYWLGEIPEIELRADLDSPEKALAIAYLDQEALEELLAGNRQAHAIVLLNRELPLRELKALDKELDQIVNKKPTIYKSAQNQYTILTRPNLLTQIITREPLSKKAERELFARLSWLREK
jgi:hypothetical protein